MTAPEEPSGQLSPAAEVFAQFLARHENGEEPDFQAFCGEHEQHAPRLRRLHARWRELAGAFEGAAPVADQSEWVEQDHEVGVDSTISLENLGRGGRGGAEGTHYEDGELIARGGMGEIRRIWDPDLRRSLAMKVLLAGDTPTPAPTASGSGSTGRSPHDARSLSRFLEEAQVTAQLHHPGIVPVHELGLDGEGRVYFTMALVRGQTLGKIFEFARQEREGWNRTRVLGVLLRVCDAVAFAHSKGVIHRDLKPANVMVGSFGETYVMDWGLAHVAGSRDRADIRLREGPPGGGEDIRSSRQDATADATDSPLMTMDGDVIGTPAYMPPEQARGEVGRVGPQADVYSIGAMLYQLLTGKVPYVTEDGGPSLRSILARVLAGPPLPVERLAPSVSPELSSICEQAMARDPEARYANVQELGEDLRAFLEMRVVRAHATGTWAELKKWVWRNKALNAASAAAVLALVVGLVFSLREKSRADENATRSEANFTLAMEAVDRMLTRVGDKTLADVPRMDVVRKEVLLDALELNQKVLASRQDDPSVRLEVARAHQRMSTIHGKLGENELAEAAQRQAIKAFEELVADNPGKPKLHAELVWSHNPLASLLLSPGRSLEAKVILEQTLVGMEEVVRTLPLDPAQRARHAIVLGQLALACHWQGDKEAALDFAVRALTIREALAEEQSDDLVYRYGAGRQCINVGYFYEQLRRYAEAQEVYQKGIVVMRGLLRVDAKKRVYRENLALLLSNLGIVQMRWQGSGNQRAVKSLREAVALNRSLVADFPDVPATRGSLGASLSNLGQALNNLRDLPAARASLEEAIRETEATLVALPDNPQIRGYIGRQHGKLFRVLMALGLHREAVQCAESYAGHESLGPALIPRQVAGWLALCADLVRKDETLTATERELLAVAHVERAMELLGQAVDAGFADPKVLEHRNYSALHDREDWQALVEVVKSRASGESGGK